MTSNNVAKQLAAVLLLAALSTPAAQHKMSLKFGTWKLNVQKSKFPAGAEPRSDTRIYEDRGGGVIMSTHTTVDRQGKEALTIYAAKFDGKEYPVVTRGSSRAQHHRLSRDRRLFGVLRSHSRWESVHPRNHLHLQRWQDADDDIGYHKCPRANRAYHRYL